MSDLLAEVDEVMRQEKLAKFWKENGPFIIAFIVLTILLTGALSAYRAWDTSVKTKQTATMIELMNTSNYPGNIIDTKLNLRSDLRGITLMGAAGTFMAQNKPEDAYTLYTRVAEDKKITDDFRHLALLITARMDMDKKDANADALLERIKPTLKNNSPYLPHARVDAALIHAELKGDYPTAIALLNTVLDTPALPPTLYERAQNLQHVYTLKNTTAQNTDKQQDKTKK